MNVHFLPSVILFVALLGGRRMPAGTPALLGSRIDLFCAM
jgi:hypothetical protein